MTRKAKKNHKKFAKIPKKSGFKRVKVSFCELN